MKFGISSYAFGWAIGFPGARSERPMDEDGLLEQAVRNGAAALQIADNLPLEEFSPDRLQRLKANAAAQNVQLEVGARRLTLQRLDLYARIARELGSPFVRFVVDDRDYQPSFAEIERILRAGLSTLEGVVLAIENHDRLPAATLRTLLESVGSRSVAICLDTANSLGAGEGIETVLRQLGPWTVNLHVKDFAIRRIDTLMGFRVEGCAAGEGQLDIPDLLNQLKAGGRCESATLELWTPRESTLVETIAKESQWVERSCRYLKPLVC